MSKIDILKNGGVLLVPGEHVERIINHPGIDIECPPRTPQNLMIAREASYTIKFRTDQEGILIYENMEHLMQDYVLYFVPEMIFRTIRRSISVLSGKALKGLLDGLKQIIEEIEAKILRES